MNTFSIQISSSKYSDDNFFDQLSSDLLDYCDETNNIVFMGDHLDVNDKNLDFQSNILSNFRYRYNRDKKHNDAGKQVLDMCKSFNLRILTGRKLDDIRGDLLITIMLVVKVPLIYELYLKTFSTT